MRIAGIFSLLKKYWLTALAIWLTLLSTQINWAVDHNSYSDLWLRLIGFTLISVVVAFVYLQMWDRWLGEKLIARDHLPARLNLLHIPLLAAVLMIPVEADGALMILIGFGMLALLASWQPDNTLDTENPLLTRIGLGFGLLLVGIVIVKSAWLSDDAYITFRTIDNFLNGYGLRWNVAERVQSYTHPLWMFVVSGFVGITGEFFLTVILLSLILSLLAIYVLLHKVNQNQSTQILLIAALISSKGFIDYSTSGLENPLNYVLITLFAWWFLSREFDLRLFTRLCLIAALGIFNRMDTLLLYALPLLLVFIQLLRDGKANIWQLLGRGLIGFLPFICWEIFSVIYYGFPFPNTYYAKLHTGIESSRYLRQGIAYLLDAMSRDTASCLVIGAGVWLAVVRKEWRLGMLAGSILIYLAYTVKVGGDFMASRFLSLPLLLSVIILSQQRFPRYWAWGLSAIVLLTGLSLDRPVLRYGSISQNEPVDWEPPASGIVDERLYYFKCGSLINLSAHWDDPDCGTIKRIQPKLDKGKVFTEYAVGRSGFWSGPEYHVLDGLALSDPLLARMPVADSEHWRIGHFLRWPPEGYVESLEKDENLVADPDLKETYESIRIITRGPIWSGERWREIWKWNSGL